MTDIPRFLMVARSTKPREAILDYMREVLNLSAASGQTFTLHVEIQPRGAAVLSVKGGGMEFQS